MRINSGAPFLLTRTMGRIIGTGLFIFVPVLALTPPIVTRSAPIATRHTQVRTAHGLGMRGGPVGTSSTTTGSPLLFRVEAMKSVSIPAPLPVLRPYIAELLKSNIPVFLPSWLPGSGERLYPFVKVHTGGYDVQLSMTRNGPCHACDRIWLIGSRGHDCSVESFTLPVRIQPGGGFSPGRWAYLSPSYGGNAGIIACFMYSKPLNPSASIFPPQQYSYQFEYVAAGVHGFTRVARSMVRVQ